MNNIYNQLLEKANNKVKQSSQSFTQADGQKRYTLTTEGNKSSDYTSEIRIVKLDADVLGYDDISDARDIDDLLNEDFTIDDLLDYFEHRVSFTDDGRVKITEYFDGDFQKDKIITVKENKGKTSITGIIVDLKRDDTFTDAYNNGVICDMPNCKKYMDEITNQGDDVEINDFVDLLDSDEIIELIRTFTSKVQAGAELRPQGLYIIVDNRIYYLTADEYSRIYYDAEDSKKSRMFKLVDDEGLYQLRANLLSNKVEVLQTVSQIIKSGYLTDKKYLNMGSESSIGTTPSMFLTNLLSDDKSTYEFLKSELKPKENVK